MPIIIPDTVGSRNTAIKWARSSSHGNYILLKGEIKLATNTWTRKYEIVISGIIVKLG